MTTPAPDQPQPPSTPTAEPPFTKQGLGHHVDNVTIMGGTHIGGHYVAGHNQGRTRVTMGDAGGDGTQALRQLIEASRDEIVGAAGSDEERVVVGYELRKLLADLEEPAEASEPVPSRWERILGVLGAGATAGSGIAQATTDVTDAIRSLGAG